MAKQWPVVQVGQIWRDRDPRSWSGNRRVVVLDADPDGKVVYRQVVGPFNDSGDWPTHRSRYQRFQRAFELISPA